MRNLTAPLLAHLASGGTKLCVCWRIERRDGVILRSTESDRDLVVSNPQAALDFLGLDGLYEARRGITASSVQSNADLSVSNMQVSGGLQDPQESDFIFDDIRGADLEAGLFDKAAFTIFQTNRTAPDEGVIVHARGTLSNIKRDTDGNWTCDLHSLAFSLSQVTGRSYGVLCDANLGDERCGVNLDDFTFPGIVTSVTSRRVFSALIDPQPLGSDSLMVSELEAGYLVYGLLTFTSGANAGYSREVAEDADGNIELFEGFPNDIAEDDEFEVYAGCNKELNIAVEMRKNTVNPNGPPTIENGRVTGDCAVKFDNAPNFRGFPNKPGPDTLVRLRSPKTKSGGSGGKK